MTDQFRALPYQTININAKVNRRISRRSTNVSLSDPAEMVMTDISSVAPFSINPGACIDNANTKMIACGVRLLFVTEGNGDLVGLITSTDLLGEKPVQFITQNGGTRGDIQVKDIMTAKENLDAFSLSSVQSSNIGDIIETMKQVGRQHMLVVDNGTNSEQETLCGLFSTTQISRQLNINIEHSGIAGSFADIERVLTTA